jgi:hypothetical protein
MSRWRVTKNGRTYMVRDDGKLIEIEELEPKTAPQPRRKSFRATICDGTEALDQRSKAIQERTHLGAGRHNLMGGIQGQARNGRSHPV